MLPLSGALTACTPSEDATTAQPPVDPDVLPDHMMYYTITANDYFGKPMAGIKAVVEKNNQEVQTIRLGDDGTERVALEKGDYTVTLSIDTEATAHSYFGYDFTYNKTAAVLSVDAPDLTCVLTQKTNGREKLTFRDESSAFAANLTGGAYNVSLASGTTYYIFRPSEPGIYEISIGSADAVIGHYGSPNWIYENAETVSENGVLRMEISRLYVGADENSTSPYLIGVNPNADGKTDCVLTFQKVSDMPLSPSEVNWTPYLNPNADKLEKFTLPEGAELVNVDVYDPDLTIVFNETDGYYHVGDENGPVILIRLTQESDYLASFFTVTLTTALGGFFYDENGAFLYKEIYNELIYQYTGRPDENYSLVQGAGVQDPNSGTYPLDSYLAHFMKNAGEKMGWWDPTNAFYRFADSDALTDATLTENAWLFACCYVKPDS